MKSFLKEIFITLLYFTPIGYLLSLLKLYSGERTPGVYVNLPSDEPIWVSVKRNPLSIDRIHWFINGGILMVQTFIIIQKNLGGDLGFSYAWIASIFGVVNIVSAFFPSFNWNGKLFKVINFPIIGVLVILSLFLTSFLVYFYLPVFMVKYR